MPFANPILIQDDLLTVGPQDGDEAIFSEVIASRLNIVSERLASVEAAIASVTASTLSELDNIFASLSLDQFSTKTPPATTSPTQWLLDNLHNPYPPSAVRRAMEKSPELGRRTVNDWFARARQRIGWTRLLRDRFSGCRSAATDAAFRAFVRDDPCCPLDVELYSAFMAVKAHANLVYVPPSPAIQDVSSHPLPPFRSPSATPSLANSTDSEDCDGGPSQSLRKRKRSFFEFSSEPHPVSPPPCKRRLAPPPERTSITTRLPSLPTTPTDNGPSPSPLTSRKRRLSESNPDEPMVKKLRGSNWTPRKQTVSDPLPLPTQLFDWESWCIEAFALPPLATTNHPLPDALDFELFNFEAFPSSQSTDIANPSADTRPEFPVQSDVWLDSVCVAPSQTEKGPWPASWECFFNFGLPSHSSPTMPSLTNSPSPSSPDTQWSLSPPEIPHFEPLEPPLFNCSSPLFKIPILYPADGVEVVDSETLLIS